MKPTIQIETWSPTSAKKELDEQERRIAAGKYRQRRLNDQSVRKYANDMRQGHWLVNNQGIGFDEEGNLVDGRHRLWAVVKSGVSIDMITFRGLASKKNGSGLMVNVIDTLDCGRVRSIGSQMMIDGIPYAHFTASVVRTIGLSAVYPRKRKFGAVPARSILKLYQEEFQKYSEEFGRLGRPRSAFFAPIIMFAKVKPRKAYQFYQEWISRVGLEEGSPVIALDTYARVHSGHAGTDETLDALSVGFLALYHYENGTKINSLRHSDIGINWFLDLDKENISKILRFIGEEAE